MNKFHIETVTNVYVRGWPQKNPRPFRVYRDGAFVDSFKTKAMAKAWVAKKSTKLEA
jgi:hypothetical protein